MRIAAISVIALLAASCGPPEHEGPLVVAVAASVRTPTTIIAEAFEKETGIHVELTGGATGALAAQARQGAPFDVFVAADRETPQALASEGVLDAATVRTYASGRLVLWSLRKEIAIDDLRDPAWASRRIAIANPETAAYGKAAMRFLECAGLDGALRDALIPAGDVRAAFEIAASGNADAALVAESVIVANTPFAVATCDGKEVLVDHALGVVAGSKRAADARRLAEYFLEPEVQTLFQGCGFEPAGETVPFDPLAKQP